MQYQVAWGGKFIGSVSWEPSCNLVGTEALKEFQNAQQRALIDNATLESWQPFVAAQHENANPNKRQRVANSKYNSK